ncbi:restriction endonuclease subunit S [Acidithiobacillus caldus]|uniref:restriction endonuclease subunit S n=1 Tax=Acidithiobacillus caldus TaxID=33059 RepID=UPI0009838635
MRYITTGNVGEGVYKEQGSAYINDETFRKLSCTEVIPGDILVSRLNAPIGRACIVPDLGTRVVTSVDNVICRPVKDYFQKYIIYRFNSSDYWHELGLIASGATMQRIGRKELGNVRIAWPPLPEQQAIAAFLDTQTTRIDALIAEYEKLIALLKEKRQALISHAVTKGLNPDVPMKDSGVEWLGEVPEGWGLRKLAWSFGLIGSGTTPPTDKIETWYSDCGTPWVTTGELRENVILETNKSVTDEALTAITALRKYPPGTLLVAMYGATIFRIGLLGIEATCNQACCALVNPCGIDVKFLFHWIIAFRDTLTTLLASGGGQPNINRETVANLKLFSPPLPEQQAIAAYLDNETAKMDALIQQAKQGIELLKERRTTLISDAVTGKIDVREYI